MQQQEPADSPPQKVPSRHTQRLVTLIKSDSKIGLSETESFNHELFISGNAAHALPNFPNLGPLVRLSSDIRLSRASLRLFVSSDTIFYPFEVLVTIQTPKFSDFMWDFKHNFYLSIMYSQVYRFFFPFSRQNSQLFFIVDMGADCEPVCINIPSRTLLRNVSEALMNHEELGAKQFEDCLVIAVSAYKDYAAFFRLSSKPKRCPESYKNFCYVPPVWTNKIS